MNRKTSDQAGPQTQAVSRLDTEQRILEAARRLFLERGFSAVSGDLLCKEARTSKTSLYKYFGDMVGVFAAVVAQEGDLFDLKVDTSPDTEDAFWDGLTGYGTRLLALLNSPFCTQLDRMIHEESRRNRELAERFYDNAYGKGHRDVALLIAHGQKQKYVSLDVSAEDLADHLISMWEGLRWVRTRLGLTESPYKDPQQWSAHCVDLLFRREPAVPAR